MERTVWVCLLCLMASLLSHAQDCSSQAAGCAGGQGYKEETLGEDGWYVDHHPSLQKHTHTIHPESSRQGEVLSRQKRQLERRGPTHLGLANLPGSVSVRGFPNMIIQAERARRHLPHTGTKKKNKVKSRVGSYSLIVHDASSPLRTFQQVTRVRRQMEEPPKKGKTGRSGAFSVLGDALSERPKRSAQKRKNPTK